MKRSYVTLMNGDDKPMFDIVLYGKRAEEVDSEVVVACLRERGLSITQFAGYRVSEPAKVPRGSATRVYTTERTIFVG